RRGGPAAQPVPLGDPRTDPRRAAAHRQTRPHPPRAGLGHHRVRRPARTRNLERSRLMTKRRARGDGGLHWDESRQRWIASVTVGYTPAGKRIVRKASGKTKTEARTKLREKIRDYEDGLAIAHHNDTVADAVTDWLTYGLSRQSESTKENYSILARTHILPDLGARKLRDLTAQDVDRWLADKAQRLSTRTLRLLHSLLNRAIVRA